MASLPMLVRRQDLDGLSGGVVRRVWLASAALALASACSPSGDEPSSPATGGESAGSEPVSAEADPVAEICGLWGTFAQLMDSEEDPTPQLVQEVLNQQARIEAVLPVELEPAWTGIVEWNQAFIDFFERTGYRPVTEETFVQAFGGDEAATAADEAQEAGYATIQTWTGSNCLDVSDSTLAFCAAWPELSLLIAELDTALNPEAYDELFARIGKMEQSVPAEVRGDWEILVQSASGFHDVVVTAGYDVDRITPEILAQAFGSVEAASAAEEAADAAHSAIDDWSITGCGDFCTRWPELQEALDTTGSWLNWVNEEAGHQRLEEYQRSLEIGTELVPGELHDDWVTAVTIREGWIAVWESVQFDPSRFGSSEPHRLALELTDPVYLEDIMGSDPEARSLLRSLESGSPALSSGDRAFLFEQWMGLAEWHSSGMRIKEWVDDNCQAATGLPGTIRVRYPPVTGSAGDTMVLAVLPAGSSVEDLEPSSTLAGWCVSVGSDPWGVEIGSEGDVHRLESEKFRAERWRRDRLCDFRWEEQPVVLDAGSYTLVAAVVAGGPWHDPAVAWTPTTCASLEVYVDGDTVIDLPDLPPCRVGSGGSPEPWRNPSPVDPSTPASGTLQIEVPGLVLPDELDQGDGGELNLIVLPAGTTLNEVGRQQVWPAGGIRTWMEPPGMGVASGLDHPIKVPVAEVHKAGSPGTLDPHWLASGPSPELLPLVRLAPGDYDVRAQVTAHSPEGERSRCVTFGVTIDGDTVARLPDWEECPKVL